MYLIFTGNGKGKTTAAIGQGVRALGNGKKVLMVQFIKGPWKSGEDEAVKVFKDDFLIHKTGLGFVGILGDKLPWVEHQKAALAGVSYAQKQLKTKKWGLLILDEVHVAIALKLIPESALSNLVDQAKDLGVDVVATGREATQAQIERADLVTEMGEVKHPYQVGTKAAAGVEY